MSNVGQPDPQHFVNITEDPSAMSREADMQADHPNGVKAVASLFTSTFGPVSIAFCGHLGKTELAVIGLAMSVFNVAGVFVIAGLLTACDTIFAQTYGSKLRSKLSLQLQKGTTRLQAISYSFEKLDLLNHFNGFHGHCTTHKVAENPSTAHDRFRPSWGSSDIWKQTKEQTESAVTERMTADLLVRLIPALIFCAWAQLLTKYVQSQNRVYISLFIIVITNGVNALLHYILLYHLQLGIKGRKSFFWMQSCGSSRRIPIASAIDISLDGTSRGPLRGTRGAAIAQTLAYFFQDVCFLCYIAFSKKIIKPFSNWSMEFIQNWGGWFRLAIPGLIMVSLEWTLFEIGGIVAGTLGERELAVQTVLISLDSISYSLLPYGFGTATGIRVGQYLGGQEPRGPRSCLSVALLVLWVISPFYYGISVALRWYIPLIFSRNPDVIAMVAELLPVAAIFQILDAANGVCGGVLRGAGLQHIGALINFFSLYLIGGPLGMCLVYLAKYNIEVLLQDWVGSNPSLMLADESIGVVDKFVHVGSCISPGDLVQDGIFIWTGKARGAFVNLRHLWRIWFGLIAGTSLQVTILLIVCFRMNWHKQVELAMKRLRYKEVQVIDVTESSEAYSSIAAPDGVCTEDKSSETRPKSRITRMVIAKRLVLIGALLIVLTISILCRNFLHLSDYFGPYCVFTNGTFITIKPDSSLENCTIVKL
ncbi:hypothetical protein T265_01158 [Opisthorchis viverrini]|uniref:Multidrug and toxin extrusion protein n=1 Tax=Opisthorchis viverrini TaxID=6198 RepID=A0A075A3M3_OPIVI|nr:hypothetical protein T265_01158 [Opisthorchis viverrini]KER32872.1 hypothetical protein T265_01158 [Opisthorchis viverrini]